MHKTIFEVAQMDCPSEENLIRLKLGEISTVAHLSFDIPNRRLTIFHSGYIDKIERLLIEINLGAKKISTVKSDQIRSILQRISIKESYYGRYWQ